MTIFKFHLVCGEFSCTKEQETTLNEIVNIAAVAATNKAIDAFQILMAGGRISNSVLRFSMHMIAFNEEVISEERRNVSESMRRSRLQPANYVDHPSRGQP
jgi:diadenosine tetraphosphate (Ap4A) HIT family hydrolase